MGIFIAYIALIFLVCCALWGATSGMRADDKPKRKRKQKRKNDDVRTIEELLPPKEKRKRTHPGLIMQDDHTVNPHCDPRDPDELLFETAPAPIKAARGMYGDYVYHASPSGSQVIYSPSAKLHVATGTEHYGYTGAHYYASRK